MISRLTTLELIVVPPRSSKHSGSKEKYYQNSLTRKWHPRSFTGLNGYLAGRTAEAVLKAGYDVRGTARRLAAGDKVKDALAAMGYPEGRVEVVEVPDVKVPGAFDDAVKGCHAILHLTSPVDEIFTTAPPEVVRKATSSVSSTAAMFEVEGDQARRFDEADWNTGAERAVEEKGRDAGPFDAYCAAKTASERLGTWCRFPNCPLSLPLPLQALLAISHYGDGERLLCSAGRAGGQAFADILAKYTAGKKKEWEGEGVRLWRGNPGQGYTEGYGPYEGELWLEAGKAVRMTGRDWIPLETCVVDSAEFFRRCL
ncbi:hypothetical protein PG994_001335 [Apiospora phragmitis]|uniref:NAD-dependent epimerase/dehydratase domain-containing protein n=1 Tax=Apiospora phragmitis TaxID=2905665 RepID=A0ABR1WT79_9PEZI